jgi:hypothetical protein
MTCSQPPVVTFPFPRSPRPFEPAPEMLALSRQSPVLRAALPDGTAAWLRLPARLPGLRLAVGFDELRYKEKMTITSVRELPVTWDP